MATRKQIKDRILQRRIDSERRKQSIDATMGLTNMDDPKEIKVQERSVKVRDVWAEMEERIKA